MRGMNYIGCLTRGVHELVSDNPTLLDRLVHRFADEVQRCQDWFYAIVVDGHEFYVVENGEDGYTAMLPNEY